MSLAMALRMRVHVHSQAQERTHSSLKYFEASVTIAVGNMDIDIALLMILRKFIEEENAWPACAPWNINGNSFPDNNGSST